MKPQPTESPSSSSARKPLNLIIDNLGSQTAPVLLAVYSKENKFLDEQDVVKHYGFKPAGKTLTAEIKDLEYGKYAIALFQDMDDDGKIETNFLGIPKDPYGFSNNYKPKLSAPSFKDCSFEYSADSHTVKISMIK